jgi:hypothetical protein
VKNQTENRTVTRTIESNASVDHLHAILADAKNIPRWAPLFADEVTQSEDGTYQVTKDGSTFTMQVPVNQSLGTVDYLRAMAGGSLGGAYLRVVPRPRGGSVIVMTVPVAPGKKPEDVSTILSEELGRLLSLAGRES